MIKPRIAWFFGDWSVSAYRQENDLYGGIAYYRVIKPAQVLRKWFDIEVIGADFLKWGVKGGDEATKYQRLEQYDLIIAKHLTNAQMASNLLATADYYKKKIIVDVDDNYFDIRKDNPAAKDYAIGQQGRYNLGAFLELCSGVTVSTYPLKEAYLKLNKNVDVLPNCNDIKDWPKRTEKKDGLIRIGYAGGSAHNDDLDLIAEPMGRILEKYPNVVFEIMGAILPEKAMELGSKMIKFGSADILKRFRFIAGTMAWQGYPEVLGSYGWDIGLAPLVDEPFNRGKSHIKWLEYSMIGATTVASPVYPYKEKIQGVSTIEEPFTGLFASTSDEWFEKLDTLVKNEKYRKQIAKNAYKYVKENWQQKMFAEKWRDCINKYL